MKKFLAGLSVAAVVVSAFLAGLAVVPHSHGEDVDHSHHKTCPVYQKSFHSADGIAEAASFVFAFAFCAALFFTFLEPRLSRVRFAFSSRAPPLAL